MELDELRCNATVRWDDKTTHHKNVGVNTPLYYTEPVKELTNEEKKKLWLNCKSSGWDRIYEFADAILRKV